MDREVANLAVCNSISVLGACMTCLHILEFISPSTVIHP
jgi:hypothetical protein